MAAALPVRAAAAPARAQRAGACGWRSVAAGGPLWRRRIRFVATSPYSSLAASKTLMPDAAAICLTERCPSILDSSSHSIVFRLI